MKKIIAALVIFYDKNGNTLIQDRRKISKWGEEYGIFGGKLREGETPEQALNRELIEEISLKNVNFIFFKKFDVTDAKYETEFERYIFLAPMPDLSLIKTNFQDEGGFEVKTFEECQSLKMPLSYHEFIAEVYNHLKQKGEIKTMKTILVDAVKCFVSEDGKIFNEMYDLLETFPNKKIILTGAGYDKFKTYNLEKMPYPVFTLQHNPEKTNPEYYKIMLKRFNLNKEEVIYFENRIEAVKSAESVGIKTFHYDPIKKDLVALKNFLDANL
jgi:HAD superfamily hydrolase (TIGR01509 family)